jgi:hypothetical protein
MADNHWSFDMAYKDATMQPSDNPDQVYIDHGYRDRADYLKSLADDFCLPLETVLELAELYGEDQDFDALVVACGEAYGDD